MSTKSKLIKLVTPKPRYGVPGIVAPLAVGTAGLVGTYWIVTHYLPGVLPDNVIVKQIANIAKEVMKQVSPVYPAQLAVANALGLQEPDPVFGQWGNLGQQASDLWEWITSPFSGGIFFVFSHDSRKQGETFAIAASGLKPDTQFIYGWKEIAFSLEQVAEPDGEWNSPNIFVDPSTAPGVHTIFLDQRPWGGGYAERRFTVLEGSV